MSTTIPTKFIGTPTISDEKIEVLKDWYITALGDGDKADRLEDCLYYNGMSDGLGDALKVLYNMGTVVTEEVVEVAKKSRSLKKPLIIVGIGVGIYALWNYEKIKNKLLAENEKLREQAREDAKIRKIQNDHKTD